MPNVLVTFDRAYDIVWLKPVGTQDIVAIDAVFAVAAGRK